MDEGEINENDTEPGIIRSGRNYFYNRNARKFGGIMALEPTLTPSVEDYIFEYFKEKFPDEMRICLAEYYAKYLITETRVWRED